MANTVIGVYDNFAQAQSALKQLLASGFTSLEVRLRPAEDTPQARSAALKAAGVTDTQSQPEAGTLRSFFRDLFGGDASDASDGSTRPTQADHYAEAVRRGSFVLTAEAASEQQRDTAAAIMEQFQPIDVDERASHWQAAGWSAHDENAAPLSEEELTSERSGYSAGAMGAVKPAADAGTQQTAIPIIAEELKVGKREVQRGGVRVVQRVIETPVQETLNLRQEHVTIERHAVDQPATAADLEAMKEGTLELREMAEEAVVSKTARIVEEVVIGKEVSEKETVISDTVRRTDVEVEQLSGVSGTMASGSMLGNSGPGLASTGGAGAGDAEFKNHWQSAYGTSGERYEDYAPAYQYGSTLASEQRYSGKDWAGSESSIRREWETAHPGNAWDKVKGAVQYGWQKITH